MEKYNVHFKKRLGQNFLKDSSIVRKIVNLGVTSKKSLVLEVGVGGAILTRELSKNFTSVLSYEIDTDLKEEIDLKLKDNYNVVVLYKDFLQSDLLEDIKDFTYEEIYFISNVPYYITTPILMKLMKSKIPFSKIIMMVQDEVGTRFKASPGTKDYSSISVYLQYFYDIKKEFLVHKNEFIPVPKVDSCVISFTPKKELLFVKDWDLFEKLVRDSFQYKRKTLKNNLKGYNLDIISSILEKYNFDLSVRAEKIPYFIFVEIANALVC